MAGITQGASGEPWSIAAVLGSGSLPWQLVGQLMTAPGMRFLADAAYGLVARNRFRLPGSTPRAGSRLPMLPRCQRRRTALGEPPEFRTSPTQGWVQPSPDRPRHGSRR